MRVEERTLDLSLDYNEVANKLHTLILFTLVVRWNPDTANLLIAVIVYDSSISQEPMFDVLDSILCNKHILFIRI